MRENQHVLCFGFGFSFLEEFEALFGARLNVVTASMWTRSKLAIFEDLIVRIRRRVPSAHPMVEIQGHNLSIQLWVFNIPVEARHVEFVSLVQIIVHLSARIWLPSAGAGIKMIVVIAINRVPGNASKFFVVDVSPLIVPLFVIRTLNAIWVKRVSNIDDKLHVFQFLHFGQHFVSQNLLT